ncbi:MAG: FAD-binding protein [Deltaproteobacteria bacterium]|nr:FAD-binding protein [Deltaproteobacteria bacterium]MBW1924743.1 FAD-binding protein [Deltaproteobacteria bacterium]MBW1950068.1 FAD-binding protein [Deltaproteobacteria bacterium]MBW2009469.1 FAD-binding protein [Deltaproteobacteria bacterium]
MKDDVKASLRELVGDANYTDQLIDLIAYSKDGSEHRHRPDAAVWVEDSGQVSEILKLANREKFPVIPRGAGTGLAGLAVAQSGGLIMDMSRMNAIREINIEDRVAVVEPGVVYADLERALEPHGFFFPPDPASGKVCTLGGNVATNAGGIKGAKYGTTKDYVMALEVVLPEGRVIRTGSRCMKTSSGYDLTRLFVGSEGTLGVVTEITLKINPRPPLSATAMATFDDVEAAGRAVSEIMHSGILPSVLELMDREGLRAVNTVTGADFPEVEAILVAETDGYTEEETVYQMKRVVDIFKKNGARSVKRAKSREEAEALWAARKAAGGAFTRINNNLFVEDLSVPMSRVPEALKVISEISGKYDLRIPTVGHAGDGNLHPCISIDARDPDQVRRMHEASAELYEKIVAMGGTLTGEHGIGLAKAPFMSMEHEEGTLALMRSLKRVMDPNNILNPGKMALDG